MATNLTYTTTLTFAEYLGISKSVPSYEEDSSGAKDTSLEVVDNSGGVSADEVIQLDFGRILASSYTISHGASPSSVTSLTEGTDYTLDKDKGEITVTSAGSTAIGTDNVYATYSYISLAGLTDTMLERYLTNAQSEIDSLTNTHFAVSTDTTPDWIQITNEVHEGRGESWREYYTKKYPISDVSTTLNGDLTSSATTITVASTDGFLSSGTIAIENEKITYSGKTSTTFTGCTRGTGDSSAVSHSSGKGVYTFIMEASITAEGSTPSFTVLERETDMEIDSDSGRSVILRDLVGPISLIGNTLPLRGTPNRVRFTYLHGHSTIPEDIRRLTHMIASKELVQQTITKAYVTGRNEFNPDLRNINESWIKQAIEHYTSWRSNNI